MASRFCHALEEYAPLCISNYSGNFDLKSSPNWSEVLSSIENSSGVVSSNNQIMYNCFSGGKLNAHSFEESKVLPASCMKFTTCRGLLDLLSGLPKGHLNFKSVSLLLKSILNLERCVIFLKCKYISCFPYRSETRPFGIFTNFPETLNSRSYIQQRTGFN